MTVRRLRNLLAAQRAGTGPAVVGDGLTVTTGTQPQGFTAENFGILDDGLGPDRDLILADLSGAGITKPDGSVDAGVWAGMSGSPVYINDRLVGAVAYSLSFGPSALAGITPAEDMAELLTADTTATRQPTTVRLSDSERRQVAATSDGPVSGDLRTLPVPLSLSSVSPTRLAWLRRQARQDGSPLLPMAGGKVPASVTAGDPGDIRAGGNFTAALSYGDITAAGIGTTTAVCGSQALAFGHPFTWSGRSRLSAHGADAVRIVKDPVFGGYKLANPTAPVGRVTQDRFAGLRAVLGGRSVPATTPVTSRVVAQNRSDETYATDRGRTEVVRQGDLAFLSLIHSYVNIDYATDRIGPGSSRVTWTIDGTADGLPFSLRRTNKYASGYDISFASVFELYRQIRRVAGFRDADVDVTGVHVGAKVVEQNRYRRITDLRVKVGDRYRSVGTLERYRHPAGTPLRLRVELTDHTGGRTVRDFAFEIARRARGRAFLTVAGGESSASGFCFLFGDCESGGGSGSFDDLLAKLDGAPRNDDLLAQLTLFRRDRPRPVARVKDERVDQVVRGRRRFSLRVVAPID